MILHAHNSRSVGDGPAPRRLGSRFAPLLALLTTHRHALAVGELVSCCALVLVSGCDSARLVGAPPPDEQAEPAAAAAGDQQPYVTVTLRGTVDWTADVLQRQLGIQGVPESRQRGLCLVTPAGRVYHVFEDKRGRAFRKDERLRNADVELVVRHYPQASLIRIVRVYFVKPDGRYLVDYWCDVCAISMIEDGPCDCCQDPNRLRERRVDAGQ